MKSTFDSYNNRCGFFFVVVFGHRHIAVEPDLLHEADL